MRSGTLAAVLALVLCATAHAQTGKPAGASIAHARTADDGAYVVEGMPPSVY